jgi:mannose/fructose/N-acetylgalactosamine-specific phosphotransferase system component IIC
LFIKALLVALWAFWIGSSLTMNTRFFAFMRPLVSGFVVGLILGDPVKGTIIGATINAVYIGIISAGGSTPADILIAGVLGPALGILADMSPEVALTVAVPIALVGVSINTLKMSLFSLFAHWADRYAEEGNMAGIVWLNILPGTIFALIYPGLATFLGVYYGPDAVRAALGFLPAGLITGLGVAGKLLPAVGYAMLLRYMTSNLGMLPMFFIGFLVAAYLKLDIMAVVGIGICLVFFINFRPQAMRKGAA